MATAGSIVVSLLAKTGSFETDMDRAARRLKGVAKEAETTGKEIDLVARRLNSLVTAAGATVVAFAGTSAAMAMQVAKSMDATAKMAEQIGTTTEALTGLRFAAQQFANVSDQTFDMAMRRMTRRIEEAAQGSGGAKNAIDALGLSAQQLSRLSPDKQFLALADAMKNTESQAARLRYTMAIFDTEGMPLVAALQRGSEEMERGIEVARRYGLVLSTDGAQAAQRFVENMDAMRFAAQGFKQELAEAVLPMLVSVTDMMREFGESAGPMGDKVEKVLTLVGAVASATAVIFASRLVSAIWKSTAAWGAATAAAAAHQMTMTRLAGAISGASTVMASASAAAAGGMAVMSRAGSLVLGVLGGPAGLVTAVGLTAAAFLTVGRDAGTASVNIDELARSFTTLNQRQLELRRFDLEDEVKKLEDQARESGQILQTMEADVAAVFEDAAKGVNITAQELENARRALLEQQEAHANNSAELDRARTLLDQVVTRLRDMDAAARGAAGGVRDLNEAMTNDAGAKYLERLASQAITAGLKTQREQLEALVKAGELVYSPADLERARKHADHIDRMNAAYKGASSAAKEFENSVKSLIAAHLPEIKATEDLHKNLATLQAAQKAGIVVGQNYTRALESINKAYAEQVKSWLPESIKKVQEQVKAAQEQQKQLQQQIRTFGLAESAVTALAIADTDAAIAKLEAAKASEVANGATAERVKEIQAEIQALQKLKELQTGIAADQQRIEWLQQQQQAWDDWSRQVDQIFQHVGQSLTDAIFEGGKSGKELLKDIFKSLTFNVLINPVMGAMQGWVTNQLGGLFGVQNPQQGGGMLGTAQNLYSGYNAITGGLNSTFGNVAQWLGQKVGSEALTSFGLGLSGTTAATGIASIGAGLGASLGTSIGTSAAAMTTTSFSAALSGGALVPGLGVGAAGGGVGAGIGAAGAAGGAAAGGAAGIGSAIGAALPWIGGALAIGSILGGGLFDREPTTRREQRTQVEYSGGSLGVTQTDDRVQAGTDAAVAQMTAAAIESANSLFRQIGIDAAIDSFHAILASSYQGDRDGVASGGRLRIGDRLVDIGIPDDENPTIKGFGGWSSAETLPRLATDIQLSVLEAFQSVGDQLPSVLSAMLEGIDVRSLGEAEAQALAERFTMLTQGASQFLAAIDAMPFAELRDLSFDAAAGLVSVSGGLENLLSAQQTYYERFYSEQEKFEHSVNQLSQALSGVGVVMPELTGSTDDMLASYRALVESLDLNTEAGQQAYVTLMQNAGAFADVAQFAGQAAEAVRNAADVAREREGLERQLLQLQGDTAELRRRELEALDESNHALQRYIWSLQDQQSAWNTAVAAGETAFSRLSQAVSAERTRLQKESQAIADALRNSISAASTTVNELTSLTGRLTSTVQRMIGQGLDEGRNRAWAQDRIDRALSVAKLTGVMPQGEDFEQALQIVAQPSEGLFQSFEDYQADFLRTAHTVSELSELADGQLSIEKRALRTLEDQLQQSQNWYQAEMERLDALLEAERQRLDVATGTYETLLTIPEALAGIQSAIANIQLIVPPAASGGGGGPGASWDDLYLSAKLAELQNKGAVSHGIDWRSGTINDLAAVFASEGLTPRLHYELYGKDEGIDEWMKRLPGFAVGTNYVPYDMVARIHEGERIIPATDNRKLMQMLARGVDRDNTIRLLQQEIRELRLMMERKLDGVERNTGDTARTNRQMVEQRQIVQVEGPVATVLVEDRTA